MIKWCLSVCFRRKSSAGSVALQECCPKAAALLLPPHNLHSFMQSFYSAIASLYPSCSSFKPILVFVLIMTPCGHYRLWPLLTPLCPVKRYFVPSSLRFISVPIELITLSLPPPPSPNHSPLSYAVLPKPSREI